MRGSAVTTSTTSTTSSARPKPSTTTTTTSTTSTSSSSGSGDGGRGGCCPAVGGTHKLAGTKRKQVGAFPDVPTAQSVNHNKLITDILEEVATNEKNNGQVHKYHAYLKAVNALKVHPQPVRSGAEARDLSGIGVKIEKKIQEILDTHKLCKLEKFRNDERQVAINLLCRVPGFGPKAAVRFVDQEHVRSLEDLQRLLPKLNKHQEIGLKHFYDLEKRVPREEISIFESKIRGELNALDPLYKMEVVGSYRRGLPNSGDIDILVTHPQYTDDCRLRKDSRGLMSNIVERLVAANIVTDIISSGFMQFMGVCKLKGDDYPYRRIDIKLFPLECFYCALLHFTGSGEHNRQLSILAQKKKFMLTEYDFSPIGITGVKGEPIAINSEQEVFEALGLEYRPPCERSL
ncbi:DNA polymerase beta [Pelomyxa schiedti]|nr:DNA polymerase beta [Pelomyxa schiedti]